METLILQVDCKPNNRDRPPQLGITVEAPYSVALQQRQQQSNKDFRNHDYQNCHMPNISNNHNQNGATNKSLSPPPNNHFQTSKQLVGNLGEHIQRGLQITQIQEGSVIDRIGSFKIGDIIVEVDNVNLQRMTFQEAQKTLREFVVKQSSHGPLWLKVLRKAASSSSLPSTTDSQSTVIERNNNSNGNSNQQDVQFNTRRIGTKHRINLTKSNVGGFGIKIAERDNMFGANRPIYITAITTTGSAYRDGRLREGDMLLEVDGIDLSVKSQPEVTKMLKAVAINKSVEFVISRQEDLRVEDQQLTNQILMIDIALNDTKSAGLGLYLKYPTLDHKDLGIWIEKVITGGAAWKDGRLQPDDQILAINGINLMGLSNSEASETLMAAVCRGIGPEATSNTIRLNIHRRDPTIVAKILHGTGNRIEHSDLPTKTHNKSYSFDKRTDNTQDSYQTAFDNTMHSNSISSSNDTSGSNKSSNDLNTQSDSAMSPQTQASNSLKLTTSCNANNSSSEKTNNSSSGISQITDFTTVQVDDNAAFEINHNNNSHAFTSPKALDIGEEAQNTELTSSVQSWDDDSFEAASGEERFQRDGFGRQSISEKRHAQLMAKNTDTFKRNQKLREERERQRQLEEQLERQRLDDGKRQDYNLTNHYYTDYYYYNLNNHCYRWKRNDSFRAAVDPSYESNTHDSNRSDYATYGQRRSIASAKVSNSIGNSTASTSNDERYLIRNSEVTNTIHKKNSLLTKFLKFGSMKRNKKKNKDIYTNF